MALTIDRFTDVAGRPLNGFFVRNRASNVVAIGAVPSRVGEGFVMPSRKRYAKDVELCRAIAKVTGLPVKWNLSCYGRAITSHGSNVAKRLDKQMRDRW